MTTLLLLPLFLFTAQCSRKPSEPDRPKIYLLGLDGLSWEMLDPLIAMSVYVFVMTVIFQRSLPDFPLFLLAAVIPFKWFTQSISDSVGSVVRNEKLIKQVFTNAAN